MCDTMVSLTADGVLFAKNSDRDVNEIQVLRWYPAHDHVPGASVRCTWSEIPQVEHTHAVLLSQPWWMWGAEMGANEHGVVIGNEAVFTRRVGDRGDGALLGMDLIRLALERARTAPEAVGVIVELLERHGQGGSCSHEHPRFTYDNSYLVADRDGAIVLETAGRKWATEQVRGPGRSISNGLTIPSFARSHADRLRGRVAQCAVRRARTEAAAARAAGPGDLMRALRDHGGSAGPRWSLVNGALAAPCAHAGGLLTATQSVASWVADLANDRHWVTATSAPCTSVFKPVRVPEPVSYDEAGAGPDRPAAPAAPTSAYDPTYLWWRHECLHRLSLRDHPASTARFVAERDAMEETWLGDVPDSASAFATAGQAETRWLADLVAADLPERRPRWLRRQWQASDAAAGLPKAGG